VYSHPLPSNKTGEREEGRRGGEVAHRLFSSLFSVKVNTTLTDTTRGF